MSDYETGPRSVAFTSIYSDDPINERVVEVLDCKRYVKGPHVEEFESRFASYCGTKSAGAVSNGTAAILLALKASGIERSDEVFVPAHTYFATVSPVFEIGATPFFVDIDPEHYTMSPDTLRDRIETADDPAAIIVTHMHGQPADMAQIGEIADEHDLTLIEDAAQAHGATIGDRTVGAFGDAACFSFYPSKNMTVAGDGGIVTSDDPEVIERVKQYRNHGRDESGEHVRLGLNYRLDETNAVVGIEQLGHLDDWNAARRSAARIYDNRLEPLDEVVTPSVRDAAQHVYHHYPIQVSDRPSLRDHLSRDKIGTAVHYENAVHQHRAVRDRVSPGSRPIAEQLCSSILSLPMHPRLDEEAVNYVCDAIEDHYK